MLFFVKAMSSEGTHVQIHLMFIFAISTLEHIRARFSLLDFQSKWVNFVVWLTTPPKLLMMLRLVRTIAFDILGTLNPVRPSCMTPLAVVFTLRNAWAHICSMNCCNKASDIETPIS